MQIARLVTASNLENQPFMEFPTRTIGPDLGRCETTSCHSRQAIAHGSMASTDRNGRARFDGQMTVSAVIFAKTLNFFGLISVLRFTFAILTLCSRSMRPWIEKRFFWLAAPLR